MWVIQDEQVHQGKNYELFIQGY